MKSLTRPFKCLYSEPASTERIRSPMWYTSLLSLCSCSSPRGCAHTDQKPSSGISLLLELLPCSEVLEIQSNLFITSTIQRYNVCSDNQSRKSAYYWKTFGKRYSIGCAFTKTSFTAKQMNDLTDDDQVYKDKGNSPVVTKQQASLCNPRLDVTQLGVVVGSCVPVAGGVETG